MVQVVWIARTILLQEHLRFNFAKLQL